MVQLHSQFELSDTPGDTHILEHPIDTGDAKPFRLPQYWQQVTYTHHDGYYSINTDNNG